VLGNCFSPMSPKTAYSLCISLNRVHLGAEGSTVLRYLLTCILMLISFALVACDDGPEQAKTTTQNDSGIFQAEKATEKKDIESTGKGIVRARLVSLDQQNTGLAALLKSVSEGTTVDSGNAESDKYRLTLNLFPDVVIAVDVAATPGTAGLPKFFGGIVVGDETSLVTLMHRQGAFSGNVRYDGKLFRIRDEGNNQYRIEEAKPVELPGHKADDN
jgi:hypothetical protein